MKSGAAISGAAHAALIAVVILGVPWFSARDRPAVPVTEVSFVTEAEFDRAQAAALAPRTEDAPAVQPVAPPPQRPAEPETPEPVAEPEPVPEPAPDPEQEVASLAPAFNPDAPLSASAVEPLLGEPAPSAPDRFAAMAPPRARPEIPLASTPTPPPPETARPAEAPAPQPAPSPDPVPPIEERPVEAPPEAAPEAASETPAETAPDEPETLALATSTRPVPRRGNIAEVLATPRVSDVVKRLQREVAREQARQQGATPPSEPTPPTEPMVTAATPPSASQEAETSLPSGPPITNAEKDGLRLAVQRCWVVPAGVRDAAELKVVLAAELAPDGKVVDGSIRLIEPSPAPDARFQAAYDAGRRALIRCSPYGDLPRDKYARWRNIEVVFNPEGMVSW